MGKWELLGKGSVWHRQYHRWCEAYIEVQPSGYATKLVCLHREWRDFDTDLARAKAKATRCAHKMLEV